MKRTWPVVVVGLLLVAPLVVACVWLRRNDYWAPIFDMAMTEMRVRDVGTAHTPLVGLPGRLGEPEVASHPGPLSFYALAPIYRLFGGTYLALRVSTVALNALAMISALLIARRRAGTAGVLAAGLILAFLELGFGLLVLTEPWNPHLPIFWFFPFLLGVWCSVSGDVWMLPTTLAIGSFCAQTHIPYAPVCGGLGLFAFTAVAVRAVKSRRRGESPRHALWSCLSALGVVFVLWAPPAVEEVTHRPGNMTLIAGFFASRADASVGLAAAAKLVVAHLDAWQLVVGTFSHPHDLAAVGPVHLPDAACGGVVLIAWAFAAGASMALRIRPLVTLHGVVGLALAVAWTGTSRIIGTPWHYLLFSQWVIAGLLVSAVVSTALAVLFRVRPEGMRRLVPSAKRLGVAVIAACSIRLATQTKQCGSSTPGPSAQLALIASNTVAAIYQGVAEARGAHGRYLVTWNDATHGGAQGLGLLNELERYGLHAGVPEVFGRLTTEHRIMDPADATARIHLATGAWIYWVGRQPSTTLVAYIEPRSIEMQKEYEALRRALLRELSRLGRKDAIAMLDWELGAADVPGLNPFLRMATARMIELGTPAAVFVMPPR